MIIRSVVLTALSLLSSSACADLNHVRPVELSDSADDHFAETQSQVPVGMRKMTNDPGQMFFLADWSYTPFFDRSGGSVEPNATVESDGTLRPPLAPHTSIAERGSAWRIASRLFKRDFQCPLGTFACASINQPNSCCSQGETCISVRDTGLGPVGCCPAGQTCGGAVAQCATAQGFTSCPGSPNGGCCIPGYACQGVGCVAYGTVSVSTRSSTSATFAGTTSPSTAQTVTTTVTIVNPSTAVSPTTVTQTLIITPSNTVSAVAPVRPTSNSDATTTASTTAAITTATSVVGTDGCPQYFYRCSAFYVGGCCRVDRDCSSTSCPPLASTTVTTGVGGTVVVPAGTTAGSCANGWQSCAASLGGGCCPGGFACGDVSCSATIAGSSGTPKAAAIAVTTTTTTGGARGKTIPIWAACLIAVLWTAMGNWELFHAF